MEGVLICEILFYTLVFALQRMRKTLYFKT